MRTPSATSHTFTAEGPFSELAVHVEGEIDIQNTAGIVKGAIERFPPSLYLRATPLTEPDGAITDFAREVRSQEATTRCRCCMPCSRACTAR